MIMNGRLAFYVFLAILILPIKLMNAVPEPSSNAVVVTSQYLATQVGTQILKAGGNAVDAAVAVGYALAVVEPCCGNLGGGGFLLLRKKNGETAFLNFRETAPEKLTPNAFIGSNGQVNRDRLSYGYLAAGIPGTVMGLNTALQRYGTLSLKQVIAPAIQLARNGFILDKTTVDRFQGGAANFRRDSHTAQVIFKEGYPYQVGEVFKQPELANTLEKIAEHGTKEFYRGDLARQLVQDSEQHGGILTQQDLANYRVIWQRPVICSYRGYTVISSPLPGAGGITLCEMLKILEVYQLKPLGFHSAAASHYMIEAMRYAFADRNNILGNSITTAKASEILLNPQHIEAIQQKIHQHPVGGAQVCLMKNIFVKPHTTHYSIVDQYGNAIAVTYTINDYFGNKIIADGLGFFLNNEMDDFTIQPEAPNGYGLVQGTANLLRPGKQPLSAMTPTIVVKDRHLVLVTGSPGGSTIVTTVLQIILNLLDFGFTVEKAVDAPHFHMQCLPDKVYVEPQVFSPSVANQLESEGYHLQPGSPFHTSTWGAAETIWRDPVSGIYYGVNDRRRSNGAAISIDFLKH